MTKSISAMELFSEMIHRYTRTQALKDGVLVDVSNMAQEAGFRWPVAMTCTAWEDCVAWSQNDNQRQVYQDESARLWDVVWMAFTTVRGTSRNASQILYRLCRVPRDGKSAQAKPTLLKLVAGPGDAGEPVITIMLPSED